VKVEFKQEDLAALRSTRQAGCSGDDDVLATCVDECFGKRKKLNWQRRRKKKNHRL